MNPKNERKLTEKEVNTFKKMYFVLKSLGHHIKSETNKIRGLQNDKMQAMQTKKIKEKR